MNRNTIITGLAVAALGFASIGSAAVGFGTGRATAPTPNACLTALEAGEDINGISSEALTIAGEAVVQAGTWDSTGLDQSTEDLNELAGDLDQIDYLGPADECKAGAR